MSAEPKPCPFCGTAGQTDINENRVWNGAKSVLINFELAHYCGVPFGGPSGVSRTYFYGWTRAEAIALWNRRVGG